MEPKIFLGPMSKNIIDAIINYANRNQVSIGLIPSRRQADYNYGYTGFGTASLTHYVKGSSDYITLQRDHGGPGQGITQDDGYESLRVDAKYFDLIHIDPFKKEGVTISNATEITAELIEYVLKVNPFARFEVGTEEAIHRYSPDDLDLFLSSLSDRLGRTFNKIDYAVVQSGTGLDLGDAINTGTFDVERLKDFVIVCNNWGIKSKEHNGDFLTAEGIQERFKAGLSGLNVAPELGLVETQTILDNSDSNQKDFLYNLALTIGNWRKWVKPDFIQEENKEKVILMAGHYMFNLKEFKDFLTTYPKTLKSEIDTALLNRIHFLISNANG